LNDIHALRRFGEAAFFGQGDEELELANFHDWSSFIYRLHRYITFIAFIGHIKMGDLSSFPWSLICATKGM